MSENKFNKFGLTKSKMEKILRCGFAYDCHYNKKIRPKRFGTPLMFGIAVDEGLNEILLKTGKDPMIAYRAVIARYELGSVDAGRYDYDRDLLTKDEKKAALKFVTKLGYKGNNIDELWNELCDKEELNNKHQKAMDYLARLSLEKKAQIIFTAYQEQVMYRIKKVHSVQKASETGIIDLVADIDKKGNKFVIDNKTASMEYEETAADYSVQLVGYAIEEKCDNVMFIVIPKKIEKQFKRECSKCGHKQNGSHRTCNKEIKGTRCNGEWNTKMTATVTIQFVEGLVTPLMKQRTIEIKKSVQTMIDNKNFHCNFANCDNIFGKPCEYRELYWKGDMTGLEDQSKKDKK